MAFEQLKDRIRETPISTILSHYIPLNKKGANLEGLCPFHPDSKPSLKVNDAKGMFKCFVCGAGGDAITFVKDFTKVEFVDALKDIAGRLGLPFEEYQKEKKKNPRLEMAFRVLNASVKLYKKVSTEMKPEPYTNFIEKRKLNEDSIEKFQIGYAPGNNSLLRYLEGIPEADRDFAQQTAMDLGMVRYNENRDSYYDFYRDRVMFPIHDHSGQIRGYSSRAVLPDQNPKYLNSGESFAFDKGGILFGFFFGKNHIRQLDQVIIVEGNMDVIMMHQYGFHHTVGTMGTALSDHSVRLLSNMTKNIFLGMDSDAAGKKAMQKINADFMALGILPKYLSFEPAKDPDEFLLSEGRLALIERQEKAPILIDVLIQELIPSIIPENLELKLQTLQRVFELLIPLKEHLAASERVVNTAKLLGLRSDSATILQDYREFLSRQKERAYPTPEKPKILTAEMLIEIEEKKSEEEKIIPLQDSGPLTKSEKVFLREIVCHPEFLTHPNRDEFLAYIGHNEVKRLFQWLINIYFEIDEAEYVPIVQDEVQRAGGYSKEVRDIVTDALFNYGNKYNDKVVQRMLKDYKVMLRLDQLKIKRKDLVDRQKVSHTQNEVDHLLVEISKLDKEIHNLKNTVP
jgi:DNA primase